MCMSLSGVKDICIPDLTYCLSNTEPIKVDG